MSKKKEEQLEVIDRDKLFSEVKELVKIKNPNTLLRHAFRCRRFA